MIPQLLYCFYYYCYYYYYYYYCYHHHSVLYNHVSSSSVSSSSSSNSSQYQDSIRTLISIKTLSYSRTYCKIYKIANIGKIGSFAGRYNGVAGDLLWQYQVNFEYPPFPDHEQSSTPLISAYTNFRPFWF